jgi:hypothetical protein
MALAFRIALGFELHDADCELIGQGGTSTKASEYSVPDARRWSGP